MARKLFMTMTRKENVYEYIEKKRTVCLKVKNRNYLVSMICVGNIVQFLTYVAT